MNWPAGILAFVLLWVPIAGIIYWVYRQNKQADEKYERDLIEIRKRYE